MMSIYSLQDETFGLQRLKESEFKVTIFDQLDRETTPSYDVTITCEDSGSPAMESHVVFSVFVEDANDNPPQFLQSSYKFNIKENSANPFLLRVEADDRDIGKNSKVTYFLGNTTSLVTSYIQVDRFTGDVMAKKAFDRELFETLNFMVVAVDGGSPRLSSQVPVVITIEDENDNMPQVPVGYSLSVQENMPIGTLVGFIKAIDPDKGRSGNVSLALLL